MKRFFALLLLAVSLSAQAGYYAKITNRPSTFFQAAGTVSSCYLTAGMAISALTNVTYTKGTVVLSLDSTAGTWSSTLSGEATAGTASGTLAECTATPSGGYQPVFAGGSSDPGVVAGGVSGGGSGGSGSGSATLSDIEFNANAFDEAFQGGLMLFVTGFGIGLIVQVIRRLRSP